MRSRTRTRLVPLALSIVATAGLAEHAARAAEHAASSSASAPDRDTYFRLFGDLGGGVGLRFNNPYRLSRVLGTRADSLSSTAGYVDVGAGISFGDPFGVQHGFVLRYDHSTAGVTQHVLTPSYIALRRWTSFEAWGRIGFPALLSPDFNVGGELAVGGGWFFLTGIGVGAEVIGDMFIGAATPEVRHPVYPILSGQLSAIVEWERLP